MIHRDSPSGLETKVDLMPFGAIAGPNGTLAWPPDGSHLMRVLGYSQALASAVRFRLDEATWVPIASGAGLACMKLVAWMDRAEGTQGRDGVDFLELLHQFAHVITDQELYDDHPEVMDRYGFHAEPAAACILGRQVLSLADDPLREVIDQALSPVSKRKMLEHYLRERCLQETQARLSAASELLEAFQAGWQGTTRPAS